MSVTVFIPLRPFSDRLALVEGGSASRRKLLRHVALYHKAAEFVPVLERDGWGVWFDGVSVAADHPDVGTRADAEARLTALGIKPGDVYIFDPSRLAGV